MSPLRTISQLPSSLCHCRCHSHVIQPLPTLLFPSASTLTPHLNCQLQCTPISPVLLLILILLPRSYLKATHQITLLTSFLTPDARLLSRPIVVTLSNNFLPVPLASPNCERPDANGRTFPRTNLEVILTTFWIHDDHHQLQFQCLVDSCSNPPVALAKIPCNWGGYDSKFQSNNVPSSCPSCHHHGIVSLSVLKETNQNKSAAQKDLLLWHCSFGCVSFQHLQQHMPPRTVKALEHHNFKSKEKLNLVTIDPRIVP